MMRLNLLRMIINLQMISILVSILVIKFFSCQLYSFFIIVMTSVLSLLNFFPQMTGVLFVIRLTLHILFELFIVVIIRINSLFLIIINSFLLIKINSFLLIILDCFAFMGIVLEFVHFFCIWLNWEKSTITLVFSVHFPFLYLHSINHYL